MTGGAPGTGTVADRDADETRRIVRERYASIATGSDGCGHGSDGENDGDSCCDSTTETEALGYDAADVAALANGADRSLGCGNPKAIANLSPGETVLDLGAGAGFDCFLAAREVGPEGQVIGVDMTPEMVSTARENARHNDVENVEFRLGEIAHLPVADATVDVVISNCVINLVPDKRAAFVEAFRVLDPGGRVAISDVVKTAQFPEDVRLDPDSLAGCVAGASTVEALDRILWDVGFEGVAIEPKAESAEFIDEWDPDRDLSEYLVSATIEAEKPAPDG